MLAKYFVMCANKKASPEERAKNTFAVGVGMLLLGVAGLAALTLLHVLGAYTVWEEINAYASGLLFWMSGGIMGAGFSTAFSARERLRDPEKMRRFEIKAHDERNIAIQSAAAKMTIVSAAGMLYLMLFVSAFLRPELSMLLSLMAVGLFVIYFVWIFWYSQKM